VASREGKWDPGFCFRIQIVILEGDCVEKFFHSDDLPISSKFVDYFFFSFFCLHFFMRQNPGRPGDESGKDLAVEK